MSDVNTTAEQATASVADLSFEQAMAELEEIVRSLEQGSGSLDEAIDSYARGAALKKHCESKLKEAQMRIDKIVLDETGAPAAEPFDPDA